MCRPAPEEDDKEREKEGSGKKKDEDDKTSEDDESSEGSGKKKDEDDETSEDDESSEGSGKKKDEDDETPEDDESSEGSRSGEEEESPTRRPLKLPDLCAERSCCDGQKCFVSENRPPIAFCAPVSIICLGDKQILTHNIFVQTMLLLCFIPGGLYREIPSSTSIPYM